MKETPQYAPIPREQLLAARQADLAAYLIARGEPLKPEGNQGSYRLPGHGGLIVTGNMFNWITQSKGGNAVDFLCDYYGMGFREAVEALTAGGFEKKAVLPPAAPERPFDFAQIEPAPNMERVIRYLTKTRGLSLELITDLIRHRQLFQEAATNNAIFPIYDGVAIVGAEVNGTLPDKRFKGIKTGSKYGCGYNLTFGDKTAYVLFFESAIDLLSFVDLSRMRGKDLAGCRLTSMMGLKQNIVEHTLQVLPEGTQPFLCVDNDEAGQNFIKAVGLPARLPHPDFKDWNDQLRALRQP